MLIDQCKYAAHIIYFEQSLLISLSKSIVDRGGNIIFKFSIHCEIIFRISINKNIRKFLVSVGFPMEQALREKSKPIIIPITYVNNFAWDAMWLIF